MTTRADGGATDERTRARGFRGNPLAVACCNECRERLMRCLVWQPDPWKALTYNRDGKWKSKITLRRAFRFGLQLKVAPRPTRNLRRPGSLRRFSGETDSTGFIPPPPLQYSLNLPGPVAEHSAILKRKEKRKKEIELFSSNGDFNYTESRTRIDFSVTKNSCLISRNHNSAILTK